LLKFPNPLYLVRFDQAASNPALPILDNEVRDNQIRQESEKDKTYGDRKSNSYNARACKQFANCLKEILELIHIFTKLEDLPFYLNNKHEDQHATVI
jgi:hypothetical protein